MKRFILFSLPLAIAILLITPSITQAQAAANIEQLEISFWPEYDRHAVLVIYRVYLASDSAIPAEIRLPIPAEVGDPYAVAWLDDGGQLIVADYESETQDEWTIVTLTSNSLIAQLEYYMDYELDGTRRKFLFQWPEGFALQNMDYDVQQPPEVNDLQVIPPPDKIATGDDGLQYHQADLGPIQSDDSITIEISYSNPGDRLTVEVIVTSVPLPISTPIAAQGGIPDLMKILPWVLGGLGLCLVLIGGYLNIHYWRRPGREKSRSPARSRKVDSVEDDTVDASVVYCHQCGTKAEISDRFCRHCGTRLRR